MIVAVITPLMTKYFIKMGCLLLVRFANTFGEYVYDTFCKKKLDFAISVESAKGNTPLVWRILASYNKKICCFPRLTQSSFFNRHRLSLATRRRDGRIGFKGSIVFDDNQTKNCRKFFWKKASSSFSSNSLKATLLFIGCIIIN